MKVYRKLEEVEVGPAGSILSVGNFDGVHRAHQLVLKEVVTRARAQSVLSLAVTFEPHPARILRPGHAPRLLTPLPRKLDLLAATGLDATLVLPFTQDFSLTTARVFVENILRRRLRAREIHEGENFHFGYKAEGTVQRLADLGDALGFLVKIYPELKLRGEVVSSSRLRELLQRGKVSRARALLGSAFSICGVPAQGRGYGSKYTVPTINLAPYDELIPAHGVYITRTRIREEYFDSVTNIGQRPTFGAESFAVETHLLDFHPMDLTEATPVEVYFLQRLRNENKFPSVDALRAQIGRDVQRARRYFRLASLLANTAAGIAG